MWFWTAGNSTPLSQTANDYAESDIRAWLNETFFMTAFSAEDIEIIEASFVDGSEDNVYLLDASAAGELTEEIRQKAASDYAACQGVKTGRRIRGLASQIRYAYRKCVLRVLHRGYLFPTRQLHQHGYLSRDNHRSVRRKYDEQTRL